MIVHCSGPLFTVPQTIASVFSKFVCQSQKHDPKILEYFEFTTFLFNKKNSGVAGGFKIMYLTPISKEPRGVFRTLSSI